jgi:DNA invertase Pin-like site-specific DNA recombinase
MRTNPAIVYARFSPRPGAEDCESCEFQIDKCRAFCAAGKLAVAGVYRDDAVSGAEIKRPGLWLAMAALKPRGSLVVWKFDRLAREAFLFFSLVKELNNKHCQLLSASGERSIREGLSASEELQYRILVLFHDYERQVIGERTSAAMRWKQAHGERMSKRIPFGWRQSPTDPAKMEPDETELAMLENMKTWNTSLGYSDLARKLNKAGMLFRGKPWVKENVRRILLRAKG